MKKFFLKEWYVMVLNKEGNQYMPVAISANLKDKVIVYCLAEAPPMFFLKALITYFKLSKNNKVRLVHQKS